MTKEIFTKKFKKFIESLSDYISTEDGQWAIKGFIDTCKNIYSISNDTKIVSKILEIHLLPKLLEFAKSNGFTLVLPKHQNYYPDITLIHQKTETKFAVDFKTTYRKNEKVCNGFTLGSHGAYFKNRDSLKNIEYPYNSYSGHFILGIIYNRDENIDEFSISKIEELKDIRSVIKNFKLFVTEKWKIASDKSGSGNTANIGSIVYIEDILNERGVFSQLGESCFDDYWINYGQIRDSNGKQIKSLEKFIEYKKGDISLIVKKRNR